VRLSDIGSAVLGPENIETKLSQSGLPLIGLAIVPRPGANYLDISKSFYEQFEALKKDLPKDIKLNIALDNTIFVKKSVLK
jgi:HAE1 family hydrophobic/amphiphilic exporter-1/multidrug efflux pump